MCRVLCLKYDATRDIDADMCQFLFEALYYPENEIRYRAVHQTCYRCGTPPYRTQLYFLPFCVFANPLADLGNFFYVMEKAYIFLE